MTAVETVTVPEPGVWQRVRWAVQDTVTMTWRDLIRTRRHETGTHGKLITLYTVMKIKVLEI